MGVAVGILFLSHLEFEICLGVFLPPLPVSNERLTNRTSTTKVNNIFILIILIILANYECYDEDVFVKVKCLFLAAMRDGNFGKLFSYIAELELNAMEI